MAKLTQKQKDALRAAHDALDLKSVAAPGPDTPDKREARQLRQSLVDAFGEEAFTDPPPSPIVTAGA